MIENDPIYSSFLNVKDPYINGIVVNQHENFYVLINEIVEEIEHIPVGVVTIKKFNPSGKLLKEFMLCKPCLGYSLAIDKKGDIYITGLVAAIKDVIFPVTKNAAQPNRKTNIYSTYTTYAFVAKIEGATFETNPTVLYATYLGGSTNTDVGYAIAVDNDGSAWVTGATASSDFPIAGKAYQEKLATANGLPTIDAFITKIDSTGSKFLYSTYLGGQQEDTGYAISTDEKGNVYVTGVADYAIVNDYYYGKPYQGKFNVSKNAFQKQFGGGDYAAFIIKLTNDGTAVYCSYLGGKIADSGTAIACDKEGNAYVAGKTFGDFHVTDGAFKPTFPGGPQSIFVTKMSSDGSSLLYSTYLGGSGSDEVKSIKLDNNNNLYLVGNTTSCDFDVTNGAYETKYFAGNGDGFLCKLNRDGNILIYSSYIGGSKKDSCEALYLSDNGNAYISGTTSSKDFYVTEDAFSKEYVGTKNDGFVVQLSLKPKEEIEIDMPDINLKKAINKILDRDNSHKITNFGMEKLPIEIDLSYKNIEDLKGLEHAVYIKSLNVNNNKIRTLMPLLNLSRLEYLDASRNLLNNIGALKNLKNILQLYLNENNIDNLDVLLEMKQLMDLEMNNNSIDDISALAGLTWLKKANFSNNKIVDLSPLKNLQHIIKTDFSNQKVRLDAIKKSMDADIVLTLDFLSNIYKTTPLIFDISDNGSYKDNTIVWKEITSDKDVTFRFRGNNNFNGLIITPIKIILKHEQGVSI